MRAYSLQLKGHSIKSCAALHNILVGGRRLRAGDILLKPEKPMQRLVTCYDYDRGLFLSEDCIPDESDICVVISADEKGLVIMGSRFLLDWRASKASAYHGLKLDLQSCGFSLLSEAEGDAP